MSLLTIQDTAEFDRILKKRKVPIIVGFFGEFSTVSRNTEGAFRKFAKESDDHLTLYVDVAAVKGIHKRFGVKSVPTVITLVDGKVTQKVVGKQDSEYYTNAFLRHSPVNRSSDGKARAFPPVTVWVSDSCPWCTRVKSYLRKQRVPFREVNVSRDPSEASALQARTGQTGVPQLSIGGRYIVGFDQPRINEYLGLKPQNKE